jgi:hypothetical protein
MTSDVQFKIMAFIEIIATPPGEAPEEVRRAWIGITIPLHPQFPSASTRTGYGVLSGPRSWIAALFPCFHKCYRWHGYNVSAPEAFAALELHNPTAAKWWADNTDFLKSDRWMLAFPEEVCRRVE